ncbi:STAS domain-containing protein [Streptomyces sp. NPDC003247]|uniref:STAS domain-containing protein n=1 Tax=Streptomyces sp. NPDC003247 TaxID=3364677 RepID=UPI0036A16618
MLQVVHDQGPVVIADLPEEVDFDTSPAISSAGHRLLSAGCRYLILNASSTETLDSSGVSTLLGFWRRLDAEGGALVLAGPAEHVRRMLQILGIEQLLVTTETLAEATVAVRELQRSSGRGTLPHLPPAGTA